MEGWVAIWSSENQVASATRHAADTAFNVLHTAKTVPENHSNFSKKSKEFSNHQKNFSTIKAHGTKDNKPIDKH